MQVFIKGVSCTCSESLQNTFLHCLLVDTQVQVSGHIQSKSVTETGLGWVLAIYSSSTVFVSVICIQSGNTIWFAQYNWNLEYPWKPKAWKTVPH